MSALEQTDPRTAPAPVQKRPGDSYRAADSQPPEKVPAEHAPSKKPLHKKTLSLKRVIVLTLVFCILGAGAIVGVNYWLDERQYESTDDAFIDGHVIAISPQVSANILKVLVDDNQPVKTGDVLVQLDPTNFQATLDQVKAVEGSMRGKLAQAHSQVAIAQANVGQAKAELDVALANQANADQDFKRFEGLDPRARSQQQLDNATMTQRSASATVEQAKAKVTAMEAQVADSQTAILTAQSDLDKATADVHQAEIQLGYCTIAAPQDGVITRKAIEEGMYVTAGQALFSIVPRDVWVTANFKETQLDQMRPGQDVSIFIDAYPEHKFHGVLQSIQRGTGSRFTLLPPENATGNFVKVVQRVPAKIVFDADELNDTDHPLAPGMSVEPAVKVRPRQSLAEALGFVSAAGKP